MAAEPPDPWQRLPGTGATGQAGAVQQPEHRLGAGADATDRAAAAQNPAGRPPGERMRFMHSSRIAVTVATPHPFRKYMFLMFFMFNFESP